MDPVKFSTCFLIIVSVSAVQCTLVAKYNMGGFIGTVHFDQTSPGSYITIITDLKSKADNTTPSGNYQLALHEYRVNYDVPDRCNTEHIGNVIGSLNASGHSYRVLPPSGIDLSGTNTIEGRSLVFTDGTTTTICATIEAAGDYITAFAYLPANLVGTMWFRQLAESSPAVTVISTSLYLTSTTNVPTSLKWQINDGVVAMDINASTAIADRCCSIGSMYDPASVGGATCNYDTQQNCSVGDLSSKHGDVPVSITGSMGWYADINLPLSGANSIIGKSIVFMDGNNNYACANIMQYPFMKAKATFSNEGVTGTIRVEQKSPLDSATINVDLRNLNNMAGGYHVHQFPVPQRLQQSGTTCGSADVAGHFNPLNVDTATDPASGVGTPDQYEVGDLSGKFGSLSGQDNYTAEFDDPNIQLFGTNSIIGRSIVIHKDDSSRWICSTIRPDVHMVTAVVRFVHPVIGYLILRQPKGLWAAETLVYAELDYSNDAAPSVDHNWHVHQNPVSADMLNPTGRCQSAGGHYNPYKVNLAGDYASSCSVKHNHFRCELGDLAGKHRKLKIRTSSPGPQKFFFSDMQLPLSGPQSILNRSIVIHDENSGGARLACGNIYQRQTRAAAVTRWTSADNSANVSGSVTFHQDATATLSGVTLVSVNLSGLNQQAGGYHVHSYPTSFPSNGTCSNVDVGGHLRPFNATYPGPTSGTQDQYEVGDLSGKCQDLTGHSVTYDVNDMNLPMKGPLSIVRRSIVVHENTAVAPRWVCGNVEETTIGSHVIQARAKFTGDISGTIHLEQSRYDDGDLSDTAITVDLANSDGTTTTGHKWHLHVSRVTGNCSTAGPHYNPYMVDVVHGYSECKPSNPLRCEMGDQTRKVGPADIGGKRFYTDVNLPLEGAVSAAKRSIVVHAANSGGDMIACANLVPYAKPADEIYILRFERIAYTISDVEAKVAASIGVDTTNVQVVALPNDALPCHVVRIYFLGPRAKQLRRLFNNLASSNNHQTLKPYAPAEQCTDTSADKPGMPKSKEFISSSDSDSDIEPKPKKKKPERKPEPEKPKEEKKPEKPKASKSESGEYKFQLSKMRFVTVSEFRGKAMVGIREFYEADGELKPGRKGISLSLDQWQKLKSYMGEIDDAVDELS